MKVVNIDRHHCNKIRSYLDSYLNDELLVETNHEVLKHVEGCADCVQALETRRRVKNLLQAAVRRDAAPASLRERIQRDIRKGRDVGKGSPARRSVAGWAAPRLQWAIAAAAAVALMVGAWGVIRSSNSHRALPPSPVALSPLEQSVEILKIGLNDHAVCAIKHNQAGKRFTPEQMAKEMGDDYDGLVSVVRERAPAGYEIVVAHKCHVSSREFVHLILKNQDDVLSLALTKKSGEAFPQSAMAAMPEASGVRLYESRLDDYEVAGFESKDYLGFIVSSLNKEDNLQIASNIAPAVRDFLARLEA
jgi:anti-sigma factor (TIGR02949 family)